MNSFVFLKITFFSQDLLCWQMQTKMLNGKELYCFEQVLLIISADMKVIKHYPTLVPNKHCLFYTNNLTLKQ